MRRHRLLGLILGIGTLFVAATPIYAQWSWANRWEGQSQSGYSYWVDVCEDGLSASSRARVQDAISEWNEIGGELHYNLLPDGADCIAALNGIGNVVSVRLAPLAGEVIANTSCSLMFGQVDQCTITLDSSSSLTTGSSCSPPNEVIPISYYTGTGSPPSTSIDVESVLVHEFGHTLSVGHSADFETAIMDNNLSDTPGDCDPRGIEKDERVHWHDTQAYTQFYGTTH